MIETNGSLIDWNSDAVQSLAKRDQIFLGRIFSGNMERYEARLKNIQFAMLGRVLDAGAGFGQWSIALEKLGNQVFPVDVDFQRSRVLKQISLQNHLETIQVAQANLEALPFEAQSFEGIFSFSSIYFLKYQQALDEFTRLIKPDGLLYINTNDLGWYLYLLATAHNATDDYKPRRYALLSILNTVLGKGHPYSELRGSQFIPRGRLLALLKERGFTILAHDGDGLIDMRNEGKTQPLLPAKFYGLNAVYEVLAKKI